MNPLFKLSEEEIKKMKAWEKGEIDPSQAQQEIDGLKKKAIAQEMVSRSTYDAKSRLEKQIRDNKEFQQKEKMKRMMKARGMTSVMGRAQAFGGGGFVPQSGPFKNQEGNSNKG